MDYEAWRPALAAFYDANGQQQGAINLRNGDRLTDSDRLTIRGLRAAMQVAEQRLAA